MKKIRVCDVVRNSVWYDPRVIKQIDEYVKADFDVNVVGEEILRCAQDDSIRGIARDI